MVLQLRDRILAGPAGSERPLTKDEMLELARGVDLEAIDFGEYCQFQKRCYARNTVLINDFVELAVICWEAGQASAIHDHGESLCLYLVTGGTLREELFRLDSDGEPQATETREWKRGDVTLADGPTIHRIANPTRSGMVTVHIYSPPLGQSVTNYTPVPTYSED